MNFKLTIITLLFVFSAACQETENYIKLADLIPVFKTENFIEKYKNDSMKREFSITSYNIDGEIQRFYSGKYIEYYKNGNVSFERVSDRFGLPLSTKTYLKNGYMWESTRTIELDTNAKTIEEFLFDEYSISITDEVVEYSGTDSVNNPLVFKKGTMINNKKSGLWKNIKKE